LATFNLEPNIYMMLAQAGLFAGNLMLVKRFFVEPYSSLKKARDLETFGQGEGAVETRKANKNLAEVIEKKIASTLLEIKAQREAARNAALEKQKNLILSARQEGEETLSAARQDLAGALEKERQKVQVIAERLKEDVYDLTVNV